METNILNFKYLGKVSLPGNYDPINEFSNLKKAVQEQLGIAFDPFIHAHLSVKTDKLGPKVLDIFEKIA